MPPHHIIPHKVLTQLHQLASTLLLLLATVCTSPLLWKWQTEKADPVESLHFVSKCFGWLCSWTNILSMRVKKTSCALHNVQWIVWLVPQPRWGPCLIKHNEKDQHYKLQCLLSMHALTDFVLSKCHSVHVQGATKMLSFTLYAKKPLTATLPIALFALPIQFCCSHSGLNFVYIVNIQWYMAIDAWSDPWLPIMIYQRLFTDKLGVVWSSKQSLWWPSRRHNEQFEFDFMVCNLTVIPQTSRDVVTKAIANSQFIKLLIFYEKAGDRFLSMLSVAPICLECGLNILVYLQTFSAARFPAHFSFMSGQIPFLFCLH